MVLNSVRIMMDKTWNVSRCWWIDPSASVCLHSREPAQVCRASGGDVKAVGLECARSMPRTASLGQHNLSCRGD